MPSTEYVSSKKRQEEYELRKEGLENIIITGTLKSREDSELPTWKNLNKWMAKKGSR